MENLYQITMFFAIPESEKILGYEKIIGRI